MPGSVPDRYGAPTPWGALSHVLGMRLKIISGDSALLAAHVGEQLGEQVGLVQPGLLTGADLNRLGDAALPACVRTTDIFVEIKPSQRERIVGCPPLHGAVRPGEGAAGRPRGVPHRLVRGIGGVSSPDRACLRTTAELARRWFYRNHARA